MPGMIDRTKRMARRCELGPTEIARRADVPLDWFKKFMRGRYKDPGVTRLEKVHDFLQLWHQAHQNQQTMAADGHESGARPD